MATMGLDSCIPLATAEHKQHATSQQPSCCKPLPLFCCWLGCASRRSVRTVYCVYWGGWLRPPNIVVKLPLMMPPFLLLLGSSPARCGDKGQESHSRGGLVRIGSGLEPLCIALRQTLDYCHAADCKLPDDAPQLPADWHLQQRLHGWCDARSMGGRKPCGAAAVLVFTQRTADTLWGPIACHRLSEQ